MKAAVYRVRERGIRLPRPKEAMEGDLVMDDCDRGDTRELKAQLLEDNGQDKLPPLIEAQVSRISQNGLVLKGTEMASRVPGSIKAKVSSSPRPGGC